MIPKCGYIPHGTPVEHVDYDTCIQDCERTKVWLNDQSFFKRRAGVCLFIKPRPRCIELMSCRAVERIMDGLFSIMARRLQRGGDFNLAVFQPERRENHGE